MSGCRRADGSSRPWRQALRLPWSRGRVLMLAIGYGTLAFAVTYALMHWALARVTAGVATIVLAAVSLVTLLLAVALRLERLSGRGVARSLLALVGITTLALAAWLADEPVTAQAVTGGVLVVLGAWFGVFSGRGRRPGKGEEAPRL